MGSVETLAEARRAKDPDLTQEQVATLLKCSQPHVCRVEAGEVEPTKAEVLKLMKLYGIRSQKQFWELWMKSFMPPLWALMLGRNERMEVIEVTTVPTLAVQLHTKAMPTGWLIERRA